ncbi:MAG TPA: SelT/SelW/SelH family protein [Candidatus Marinimicrobia bacterium]|nr:SelT/SelW/SelH family protein [Candidatus Neomarinimicrobiota bacterium]HIC36937.1 SelT/SelW/SelH family protein [Candidatus Neomarinimicrobiota bacterium]HIN01875.1 SelT/SelW/SelH family protein [Candidatus Neomarinimicrobiota bacterium]
MEVELKTKFPKVDTKLISSGGGVFEVTLDGELIYSKKALDRFPEEGEIETLIKDYSN